jgi:hypothetical protein
MKTSKIIAGGFAGGVAFFLLGWLIYGILLMNFMNAHSNQCAARQMQDMVWWAIILSNLTLGFLLTFIFSWSGISGIASGARIGAITGLLLALSIDLSFYSMTTLYTGLSVIVVDVVANTVMFSVVGMVIAWVTGLGRKG